MSARTPSVEGGALHLHGAGAIALGSPEWFTWLADDTHHSFHFAGAAGGFTARKERKQRGQWYWVAYRQAHCKLHKVYLGKTEMLSEAHLHAADLALGAACAPPAEAENSGQ
ncbi:hypothetical protein SE17_07475 [Kouleothrix aurantiaca]|uniref:Uncharacterized protein n=1 Tax=Kouleothrix aurantiaca TaxID=186479 RepID=A0A0P9FAV6_9CHLR|nr:hypothetical protein SE17_07475 [Kouleothrix aurantiaca]